MNKALVAGGVIIILIVLGAALYSAYSGGREEKTLRVLNYSSYISPAVLEGFEKEYGVRVVLDEYESAEEAWAKLKAGGAGYDVIITAHSYVGLAASMGLLQALNKSLLPNLANLDPRVASHPADPNQAYAVPYMWGTTGIAYVSTCVTDPPRSWRELLSPAYLSKYQGRASLLSEFSEAMMAAMIALGYDPSVKGNWNDQVMGQVEDLLKSVKPYLVGFYGASQYMPALENGQLCLAQAWNGDVLVVRENASVVEYIYPEDGALYWVDYTVIPRDAGHVVEAHEFINYLLRPDVAAENVKFVLYASAVKKSLLASLAKERNDTELQGVLDDPLIYPPDDVKLIPSPVFDERMSSYVETVRLHVLGG